MYRKIQTIKENVFNNIGKIRTSQINWFAQSARIVSTACLFLETSSLVGNLGGYLGYLPADWHSEPDPILRGPENTSSPESLSFWIIKTSALMNRQSFSVSFVVAELKPTTACRIQDSGNTSCNSWQTSIQNQQGLPNARHQVQGALTRLMQKAGLLCT